MSGLNFTQKKKLHVVALCLSRIHAETEQKMYQELRTQLQAHGYHLLVFNTSVNLFDHDAYSIGEESVFSLIPYHLLEALILLPETIKQEELVSAVIERAHSEHIPVITVDKPLAGCYNISFSYANTMEKIIRHIVEDHGCTRVNFIAGIKGNSFSEERLEAYKRVLTENHIPVDERRIGYGDFWDVPTYEVMEEFFSSPLEFPQAIICANDSMAIAACTKLTERGYQIPEDVIVTGFDGIEAERYFTPRLTTARLNLTEAASVIMQLLEDLNAGRTAPMNYTVFHEISHSQSCGCQSRSVTNANARVLSLCDHMDRVTDFNQQMSRMFSTLTGLTIDEAIFKLRHYIDRLKLPTVSIYAAENYLSTKTDEQSIGAMTPAAITILNKRSGVYTEARERFHVSALAPDLDQLFAEGDPLLILPIHFQDIVQAYMLLQLPQDFDEFTQLYMLHINLNQIMGLLHSQHSLRAALTDMEYMHSHDYMTKLYNRRGFYTQINTLVDTARQKNCLFAVYSIDMNGLKYINDTHGHQEGDFAINQIALALEASAPKHALCSRFGGDEFTVAMVISDSNQDPQEYCTSVKAYLDGINRSSGKPYTISASFGVSCCVPDEHFSFDQLILQADEKMYHEKEQNPYFRGKTEAKDVRGRQPRI